MRHLFVCLALATAAGAGAEALDPGLQGCWRSQHVQVTLADHRHRDQNGDCVTRYDGTQARSQCHSETGDTLTLSNIEPAGPDRLRVTPLDPTTGIAKAPASDVRYRIQGEWLLIERSFTNAPPTGAPGPQPTRLQSVSIRVRSAPGDASACKPRGDNPLRIGRTPVSSIDLSVPRGWEPWRVDPASDPRLGPAVNASFLVGAFVPQGTADSPSGPATLVLVLDDVRSGPVPVGSTEFAAVKKRFAAELGAARLTCDRPDRVCAHLRLKDGQVYTELLPVKGRVAMVSATVARPGPDVTTLLRESVQAFVERLRQDNAP